MRVLVLCPYPEGVAPSQRFKHEQYFDYLRAQGIEVTVSPFMTRALWAIVYEPGRLPQKVLWTLVGYARRIVDLLRLPFYDGAFVSLHVTPIGTSFFERLARLASRRIIYDIDDCIHLGRTSSANGLVRWIKGAGKVHYLLRAADHVLAATPWLEEMARRSNANVTHISSTVRTDALRPADRPREGKVVIGWSGSHSTAPYLRLIERVFARLWERHDWKLLVIGGRHFRLAGRDVEYLPWRAETETADLQRMDVGVYPLPDDEWVLGKSSLKAIQYMSIGIPCVASALGTAPRAIEDGVTGFLVRSEDEWVERLERLLLDAELRRAMGARARERVERLFSVSATAPRYLEVFEKTLRAS